jgi:hypothetical protein
VEVLLMNKSEYVRGLPRDMTPHEVVRRAKADGIRISEATVYAARRQQPVAPTALHPVARRDTGIARTEKERELLELSLELGVTQATELLENLRARLRAVAY